MIYTIVKQHPDGPASHGTTAASELLLKARLPPHSIDSTIMSTIKCLYAVQNIMCLFLLLDKIKGSLTPHWDPVPLLRTQKKQL